MGDAVADVLFGDYNPAGRLPVTFYRSDSDLPPYQDYSMAGRTYRYLNQEALFPFGFGLSYTTFRYKNLRLPSRIQRGQPLEVEVEVCNTGTQDGEEVVQLYLTHPSGAAYRTAHCALKDFQRISLRKGESRKLCFTLLPESLEVVTEQGISRQLPGPLSVFVGGGQPSLRQTKAGISGHVTVK